MTNLISVVENAQMSGKEVPNFAPGDTVSVQVKVKEGERERLQNFEGTVIAVRKRGLNSSFTVRKISYGEGVERVFQTFSPLLASITVVRKGDVRRAKLYYLRDRSGKAARIKEKLVSKGKKDGTTAASASQVQASAAKKSAPATKSEAATEE